jgi:hypothetical protein
MRARTQLICQDGRMTATTRPNRILLIILGVIAALVILALVVVLGRGEPMQQDESTPAGIVQRYSAAVIDGDETGAMAYLTQEVRDQCERMEQFGATQGIAITLVSTKERSNSADVTVSIASASNGPFGAQSSYEDVFGLVKANGDWRIQSAPWQLTVCMNTGF